MTTPADPDGLGLEPVPPVTTYSYVDPLGVDYTVVTVSWEPVTTYDDGSPAAVLHYIVEVSTDGGATFAGAITVAGDTTTAELPRFLSGTTIWWRVQAIPVTGSPSDPSEPTEVVMPADLTPPPVPAAPTLTAKLGVISVSWNGTFVNGLRPDDFAQVAVYMSSDGGVNFVPVGTMPSAGKLAVGGQPIGSIRYFKLQASDVRGNTSDSSTAASVTVVGVQGPDLEANSVTANAIKAGALDAFIVTGGTIRSAASGARVQMDGFGITQYSASEQALSTWSSSGFNFKTATSGARLELNSGGLNLYNSAGQNVVALTSTGTATVTGKYTTGQAAAYPRIEIDNTSTSTVGFGMRFYSTAANTAYSPAGIWANQPGFSYRGGLFLASERSSSTSALSTVDVSSQFGVQINALPASTVTANGAVASAYFAPAADSTTDAYSSVSFSGQQLSMTSLTPNAAGGTGVEGTWWETKLVIGGAPNRTKRSAQVTMSAADYMWLRCGIFPNTDQLVLNSVTGPHSPQAQLVSSGGQVHLVAGRGVQGVGSDNSVYMTVLDKVVMRTHDGTSASDRMIVDATYGVQNKSGSRTSRWGNNGTTSWLTDDGSNIDTWLTGTASGTVNAGTYSATFNYYVSFDRMVTFNYSITFSTAPTAGAGSFTNLLPAAAMPVNRSYGAGKGGTANTVTSGRVDAASRTLVVFSLAAVSGATYEGTVTYPIAKPS